MMNWKANNINNNKHKMSCDEGGGPSIIIRPNGDDEKGNSSLPSKDIYLYNDITSESMLALTRQIKELTKHLKIMKMCYGTTTEIPIDLHVKCDGGEVFSAIALVDTIKNNDIPIHSYIDGFAASAATLLSVVAKKRYITKNSCMLLHSISGAFWGNFCQLTEEFQNVSLIMKIIKRIYIPHTKFKSNDLDELLKHDLYLEAKECKKFGLVDEVI